LRPPSPPPSFLCGKFSHLPFRTKQDTHSKHTRSKTHASRASRGCASLRLQCFGFHKRYVSRGAGRPTPTPDGRSLESFFSSRLPATKPAAEPAVLLSPLFSSRLAAATPATKAAAARARRLALSAFFELAARRQRPDLSHARALLVRIIGQTLLNGARLFLARGSCRRGGGRGRGAAAARRRTHYGRLPLPLSLFTSSPPPR
jgi:hypothetical protein